MPSYIVAPIAESLQGVLETLVVTPTLKAYWPAPSMISTAPAAVIDLPTVERTPLDTRERELGAEDWRLSFPVTIFVDLAVADRDQLRALDLLELFIEAIDANPSMGDNLIDDTKVITGRPAVDLTDQARPLLTYDCEVQVWRRVPT